MTPADVLRKAADYIEVHGWVQDARNTTIDWGPCCTVNAMWRVAEPFRTDPERWRAYGAAIRALKAELDTNTGDDISTWNDTPGRTAEEVISTLRTVADRLDAHPGRDRGEGEAGR